MILIFILIIALLAIWIGYQLTHAPDMPGYEEFSRKRQELADFIEELKEEGDQE